MTRHIPAKDPRAAAVVTAIRTGDVAALKRLLAEHPDLATSRIGGDDPGDQSRTLLHAACHGGQRRVAAYLLPRGADVNWIGHGGMTPLDVARRDDAVRLVGRAAADDLVEWLRARGAKSTEDLRRESSSLRDGSGIGRSR